MLDSPPNALSELGSIGLGVIFSVSVAWLHASYVISTRLSVLTFRLDGGRFRSIANVCNRPIGDDQDRLTPRFAMIETRNGPYDVLLFDVEHHGFKTVARPFRSPRATSNFDPVHSKPGKAFP